MRYPIAIEPGDETTAFGVIVPDLPGCFSAGDSLDEALAGAEEAAAAWVDAALDAGEAIPHPSSLDTLRHNAEFAGWTFGVITLDPAALDDTTERINITLPPPRPKTPRRNGARSGRKPIRIYRGDDVGGAKGGGLGMAGAGYWCTNSMPVQAV